MGNVRKYILFATIACIQIIIVASSVHARPRIAVVGGTIIDWKIVSPSILHRTVAIVNAGDDTLRIVSVKPGCSCTTAPISKNVIPAGDTAWLVVSMDVQRRSGTVRTPVEISSNDSTNNNLTLTLNAFVGQELIASPKRFPMVTNAVVGNEYSVSVKIFNTTDTIITIMPPVATDDLDLKIICPLPMHNVLNAHDSTDIVVTFTALKSGSFTNEITIPSSSKLTPGLPLTLFCRAVSASPSSPK